MMSNTSFTLCLILLILPVIVDSLSFHSKKQQTKAQTIEKFYFPNERPQQALSEADPQDRQVLKLEKFIWSSCSGPDALLDIDKLEVSDPIAIPGNLTVSVISNLADDVTSPLKIGVLVQRKIGFIWVDVPCIDNIGSCTYSDFCPLIPFPPDKPCPDPFTTLGLPCHCPVSKGQYTVTQGVIPVPDEHIPEFLTRGNYYVRVQASVGGMEVTCLKLTFSLV